MEIKQTRPGTMKSMVGLGGADKQIDFLSQKILPSVSSLLAASPPCLSSLPGTPPLLSAYQDPLPTDFHSREPKYPFRPEGGYVPSVHDPNLQW
jgi:hypothetical protein